VSPRVKNNGGSEDRPGDWPATDLVDAGDEAITGGPEGLFFTYSRQQTGSSRHLAA